MANKQNWLNALVDIIGKNSIPVHHLLLKFNYSIYFYKDMKIF